MSNHEKNPTSAIVDRLSEPNGINPLFARRQLAARIAEIRKGIGATQQGIADRLDYSAAKQLRIEGSKTGVKKNDLLAFFDTFGMAEAERAPLLALQRATKQFAWYSEYKDIVNKRPNFNKLIEYEASARTLHIFSPYVPPLLQTHKYAHALAKHSIHKIDQERLANLTIRRQRLFERSDPTHVDIILDEAALHSQVGDEENRQLILSAQLDNIKGRIEQENPDLNIGIIPFKAGIVPGMTGGAFMINNFGDNDVATVWEFGAGELSIEENTASSRKCMWLFQCLGSAAVYGEAAIGLIENAQPGL